MNELTEIIESTLRSLPEQIFTFVVPFVLPIIVAGIIWCVAKFLVKKFVYSYALATGDTRRQANLKSKKAEAAIDLLSTINDFNNMGKK